MNNPLLESHSLPPFQDIEIKHIVPAIKELIDSNQAQIDTILNNETDYNWFSLVEPMEKLDLKLGNAWSPVSHMHSVVDSEALRQAYDECLPMLTEYSTAMGQNRQLFAAYNAIKQKHFSSLDNVQQKIMDDALRDFKLAGIALEGNEKIRFGEIRKRLSELTSNYEKNVLDATMAWSLNFDDDTRLKGLPDSALAQAKQSAETVKQKGYRITLEFPSYYAVISYAEDRKLRQEIYSAFCTRASDQGPDAGQYDNSELMVEILSLRHELSQLLGFDNYADLSLATKMAENAQQVFDFLNDLALRSKPQAEKELKQLTEFAHKRDGIETLQPWDIAYYSEKLREQQFDFNEEALRPYFPENQVIKGMFSIVSTLYGISFSERNDVQSWHKDVRFFDIFDADKNLIAGFYLDLYARPHKRGGAWMDDCRNRVKFSDGEEEIAIAYLTCNFNGPVGDTPALFTHDEVVTLFHEFGHGLHHMLTEINYAQVSGISGVPWDAVELPSQFNENFCYHKQTLKIISGHYETGAPLPDDLIDKLLAARNFQSAMMMVRQLEFSLFDFHLHHDFNPADKVDIQQTLNNIRQKVAVVIPPEFNRFQHAFSHIFSGGYAAGYYSYKWAEVLSADAFSKFEEEGVLNPETGKLFLKHILSQGGADTPMNLFKNFRGREPDISALLRHSGIPEAANQS